MRPSATGTNPSRPSSGVASSRFQSEVVSPRRRHGSLSSNATTAERSAAANGRITTSAAAVMPASLKELAHRERLEPAGGKQVGHQGLDHLPRVGALAVGVEDHDAAVTNAGAHGAQDVVGAEVRVG